MKPTLDEIRQRTEAIGRARVKVGILRSKGGGAAHDAGEEITLLELGLIHEYGSEAAGIPEHSWLRGAFRDKAAQKKIATTQRALVSNVMAGRMTVAQAAGTLGQVALALVKTRITSGDGIPPPLKPATIKRKGSSRPLVDTGRLLGAITYEVVA